MKRARYPITEVLWLDSGQLENGDWLTIEFVRDNMDDLAQRSVGFLIAESDTTLVLARSISEWEDMVEKVEGVLCIPKVSIIDRR
jgi:hypothetical protein